MVAERVVINGVMHNGVVVAQGDVKLPEGALVEIVIEPPVITPELQAEFDAWERASDEDFAAFEAMLQAEEAKASQEATEGQM